MTRWSVRAVTQTRRQVERDELSVRKSFLHVGGAYTLLFTVWQVMLDLGDGLPANHEATIRVDQLQTRTGHRLDKDFSRFIIVTVDIGSQIDNMTIVSCLLNVPVS